MAMEEYWGIDAGPKKSTKELVAELRSKAKWKSSRVVSIKLTDGTTVWFQKVYKHVLGKSVFEIIDEEEYVYRKLAGTLEHKYDPDDWPKESSIGGSYMTGP